MRTETSVKTKEHPKNPTTAITLVTKGAALVRETASDHPSHQPQTARKPHDRTLRNRLFIALHIF
jgi:hypothetical protein